MAFLNIPESGLSTSIATQIGKLKGEFETKVGSSLNSIQEKLKDGCPSDAELENIKNQLDNISELSNNIAERLNRYRSIIPPLKQGAGALSGIVTVLKGLPIPGLALTAGVTTTFSDILTLVKEFSTQLKNSATTIEGLLAQADSLNQILKSAEQVSKKVDIALQFCALADGDLPAECIDSIVNGTPEEAAQCINDFNKRLGSNLQNENKLKEESTTDDEERYTGPDGTEYIVRIIQVDSEFTRAPKRQAIAETLQGIIRYRSDSSFSSSVGVLKRQVKFRIDNSQV